MTSHSTETHTREFSADPLSRIEEEQQGYFARGQEQLRELTREREGTTVLIALAAGFGIGLLLGGSLAGSGRSSSWHHRETAENLGRRMLHRIDQFLPDAITSRLHS